MVHSPYAHNSWVWDTRKLRVRNSVWVFHVVPLLPSRIRFAGRWNLHRPKHPNLITLTCVFVCCCCSKIFIFLFTYFYWFIGKSFAYIEREQQKEIVICQLTSQMAAVARVGPSYSLEPGNPSRSHVDDMAQPLGLSSSTFPGALVWS